MIGLLRRRASLDEPARQALGRLLATPKFELIPLKNVHAQAASLPDGATVSVTASPAKGLEATVELCEQLRDRGFRPIVHLSARMVRDRTHLVSLLGRLRDSGIDRAFIVGGDAEEPGAFPDGLSLLRELGEVGHPFTELGIPCYPEGHAFIPDDALLEALTAKAPFAHYMTTQLCFNPGAIRRWLLERRADGISLPAVIGVPGVTEPHRLLAISARIGVKDTRRFLVKNVGFVARLARSGGFYKPDGFLRGLAPLMADRGAGIEGLHLYTFNQVAATEAWRRTAVAALQAEST